MAGGRIGRGLTVAACAALLFAGCGENPAHKAYRQGMQELKRGHYSQSIRLLQKSIKLGGTNVPVAVIYNGLGLAYFRIGQPENSIGAFEFSARLDPKLTEPVYNLGVILAESGREVQAVACFEKAAQLEPSGTRALEYLGRIYYRHQRWDNAREALDEARRRAPREPSILTALALLELQSTNIMPAISCLQEALSHDARYAPALYNLAIVNHLWLKNDSQAEQLFKDYLRLEPKGEGAEKASQIIQNISKLAAAAEEPPVIVPPAKANAPDSPPTMVADKPNPEQPKPAAPAVVAKVTPPTCEELLQVARKLEKQDRFEAAINNYLLAARQAEREGKPSVRDQAAREANGLCAQNAVSHYEMGLYWVERGQTDEALSHLKQAAELSNTWYEAHLAVARVALDKSEYDTAVVSLKKADQSSPERPEALWMLAQLYDRNLSLTNQAIQAYELFAKRFDGDGRVKEGNGRLKELKRGMDQNGRPSDPAQTEMQTRWRWLFKSRSQPNPEN